MLNRTDDYCKVIKEAGAAVIEAKKALESVNIPGVSIADIITAERLEVRRYKSRKPGMDHCAVVKLGEDYWGIPRHILTVVSNKK